MFMRESEGIYEFGSKRIMVKVEKSNSLAIFSLDGAASFLDGATYSLDTATFESLGLYSPNSDYTPPTFFDFSTSTGMVRS